MLLDIPLEKLTNYLGKNGAGSETAVYGEKAGSDWKSVPAKLVNQSLKKRPKESRGVINNFQNLRTLNIKVCAPNPARIQEYFNEKRAAVQREIAGWLKQAVAEIDRQKEIKRGSRKKNDQDKPREKKVLTKHERLEADLKSLHDLFEVIKPADYPPYTA